MLKAFKDTIVNRALQSLEGNLKLRVQKIVTHDDTETYKKKHCSSLVVFSS